MNRLEIGRLGQGWPSWRWLSLAAVLFAVSCKPKSGTGSDELLMHLKLTGFVQHGSKHWALLLLAEPGKPTEYLKLLEGQRHGDLEIVTIDAVEQTVGVRVGDREESLSFATHGLQPGDGYAWLQRLSADEHARLYNTPEKQRFVEDHAQAHELRQRQELARELQEREQLPK